MSEQSGLLRLIGVSYRRIEGLLRPLLYRREKAAVLARFPQLEPVMAAYEARYIRSEYGAHDQSLLERRQRRLTDEAFVYGSTPWQTFLKIADSLELHDGDVYCEPGCGTGHLCFLMHQGYGLRVTGIETIATFVETAAAIRQELAAAGRDVSGLNFVCGDFLAADLSDATVIFVAGTCFPAELRAALSARIAAEAPPGARVISLTHPLGPPFVLSHTVEGVFSWGRDQALIYRLAARP